VQEEVYLENLEEIADVGYSWILLYICIFLIIALIIGSYILYKLYKRPKPILPDIAPQIDIGFEITQLLQQMQTLKNNVIHDNIVDHDVICEHASLILRKMITLTQNIPAAAMTKKELEKLNDHKLDDLLSEFYKIEYAKSPSTKDAILTIIDSSINEIHKWSSNIR
jgi:hypothetical protein